MNGFSISMNGSVFDNEIITKESIKKIIDYVTKETQCGNYEFFTLIDDKTGNFIQTALEGNEYHVEIRYLHIGGQKGIYVKKVFGYKDMIELFHDFYERKIINTEGFEDISHYLN